MTTDVTQPKSRAKRTDMADMERQAIIARQEEEISYLRDQNKALLILNNKLADQLGEVTRMLPPPAVTQPEEKPQTKVIIPSKKTDGGLSYANNNLH